VKDHEPIDSSRRAQNRAALVGSGEHPGLRCPRTNFADRRQLASSTRTVVTRHLPLEFQTELYPGRTDVLRYA